MPQRKTIDNPSERELLVRFCFQTCYIWNNNDNLGPGTIQSLLHRSLPCHGQGACVTQ